MIEPIVIGLIWLLLLSLLGCVGPMPELARQLCGLAAVSFAVATLRPRVVGSASRRRWEWVAAIAMLCALWRAPMTAWYFAIPAAMYLLCDWRVRALAVVAMSAALVRGVATSTGVFEPVGTLIASVFVQVGWSGAAKPPVLGPSAIGLDSVLTTAFAVVCLLGRARRRLAAALVAIAIAATVAQWIVAKWLYAHGPHAGHPHGAPDFWWLYVLDGILIAVVVAASALAGAAASRGDDSNSHLPVSRRLAIGAVCCLFAVSMGGLRWIGEPDKRVSFLNAGGFDWKRASYDQLGPFSTGMFGLLPEYLARSGWAVSTVDRTDIGALTTERCRLLVMINCPIHWSDSERAAVERFVRSGGSLLVLGDHTNVFGLRDGFNTLTSAWGVAFRFDAAYPLRGDWNDDIETQPGPLGLWPDAVQSGISVGASLAASYPAIPLITARYALSDDGETGNTVGAFLGNYHWDAGERGGDLTLATVTPLGRGLAVVYGDTSGFQNGGLPETFEVNVEPIMSAMATPPLLGIPGEGERWGGVAVAVCTVGLLAIGRLRYWCVACLGLVAPVALNAQRCLVLSRAASHIDLSDSVILDETHGEDLGHYDAGWNPIGAIASAIERAGLIVRLKTHSEVSDVRGAAGVALLAASVPLTTREIDELDQIMRRGGAVMIATGSDYAGSVAGLLGKYGLAVDQVKLGPTPPQEQQDARNPRFCDPSPISVQDRRSVKILYQRGNDVLAVQRRVGKGSLILISDPRFFSDQNVEGVWGWWGSDLQLIDEILRQFVVPDSRPARIEFPPPAAASQP